MFTRLWKKGVRSFACSAAILFAANAVEAQQALIPQAPAALPSASTPANADADLRARVERLEQQNQELLRALQNMQAGLPQAGTAAPTTIIQDPSKSVPGDSDAVKKIVDDELAKRDAAKKQEEDAKPAVLADQGYRVGSDMKASASFKDGLFLWLDTPNKDFTMHIGGWMQYDNVWWTQSAALRAAPGSRPGPAQGVASGIAGGGIGDLQDGEYFRRIRPFVEGTFWENGEYRLILALENDQFSITGFDEFWVGYKDIPWLGTIRVGHIKNQFGVEGDTTASSRAMTFMERSAYSEAIEQNQNFVTGILFTNNYACQRGSWEFVLARPDQAASSGEFFGDGQFLWQGRGTYLPIDEQDGRHLLHLGISGGWRDGQANQGNSPFRTTQLRARPEIRDDDPAGSPGGGQAIPDANSNRIIDTGVIAIEGSEWLLGSELLYIRGPFSVQAEYGFHWIDGAVGIAPAGTKFSPALVPTQDYVFGGGYVQLAYTLTGENRLYDRRLGTIAREYFAPRSNFWIVRDENGKFDGSLGAWEIAARYSYVNLNDGTGANRIQGGVLNGVTVGLNWYLNSNLKVQFDWAYDQRSQCPAGTAEGYTSGFGTRVQFQF